MLRETETEGVDTPTLASFCEWLWRIDIRRSHSGVVVNNDEYAALRCIIRFIDEDGKNGKAFIEVCREMAETEKKNHEDFIHRQNDVFLATMC